MDYKTSHKTQYVSVTKVLKALETLRELGHPYYQFVPDIEKFKKWTKKKVSWIEVEDVIKKTIASKPS